MIARGRWEVEKAAGAVLSGRVEMRAWSRPPGCSPRPAPGLGWDPSAVCGPTLHPCRLLLCGYASS